jgi:hypothetical protein
VAQERSRLPFAALGFAAAAAFSSWNPLSAPFGLVVGLSALVLGVRALRRSPSRRPRALSTAAIALSAGAVLASALVLALTAGVGRELGGTSVVAVPPSAEVEGELDAADERTRAARERARSELEALDRPDEGRAAGSAGPAGGDPGAPARR